MKSFNHYRSLRRLVDKYYIMPINQETLNRRLFNLLHNRFDDTTALDSEGEKSPIEDEADIFRFTFTKDGKGYGTVYVTVDNSRTLKIYYDDEIADSSDSPTPGIGYNDTWYGLLEFLKRWAKDNQLGWEPSNKKHLHGDMARRNHVKKQEKMMEGYYPMGKKASYSDNVPNVKMVIQHTREIQEGEQRYRNVAKIFLENAEGERILAPTTKPGIARVYARHIAEGGLPHDERWNHIKGLCEEYSKMAGFVRATRGKQFNESAQGLIESGINHYSALRESLSKLAGHKGYNAYFESWTPPLMEDDGDVSSINELFVQETMDPRIESVMPILSKLHKTVAEMKEVDALAEWADSLTEAPTETLKKHNKVLKKDMKALSLEEEELDEATDAYSIPEGMNDEQGVAEGSNAGDIELSHSMSPDMLYVHATSDGTDVGGARFKKIDGAWTGDIVHVYPQFRRQGIATKIYDYAEDLVGKIIPSKTLKPKGKKFWDNRDKQGVAEDLDANQKRVGQLGPTEKVGKNGAVGKLVGACENFINTDVQAVVTEEEGRPYMCVHAKKGKYNVTANSSYEAAKKAAAKWGLKSTAGIDAHLLDTPKDSASLEENQISEGQADLDAIKRIIKK